MAYLTSFKSSMPRQHWWPSRRKRRVGGVFTGESQVGIKHALCWQRFLFFGRNSAWKRPWLDNFFKPSPFERWEWSFKSRRCKRMLELKLYLIQWTTFLINRRRISVFFLWLKTMQVSICLQWSWQIGLQNAPRPVEIPPKRSSLAGGQYAGNPNYYNCNNFFSVIFFWNRPNYGATLSLKAYRRLAQESEGW